MIYGFILILCILVAWKWVDSIDYMNDLHADYEAEDFL